MQITINGAPRTDDMHDPQTDIGSLRTIRDKELDAAHEYQKRIHEAVTTKRFRLALSLKKLVRGCQKAAIDAQKLLDEKVVSYSRASAC